MIRNILFLLVAAIAINTNAANLTSISQTDMSLESSNRVGRGTVEYVYSITQLNNGDDADNVTGTVVSTAASVDIVKGEFSIGQINRNESVQVSEAIIIRVDRSIPFDPASLVFTYQGDSLGAGGPPGDDYVEPESYGTLTSPISPTSFHGVGDSFVLDVTGAYFTPEAYQITASRNGDLIEGFELTPSQLTFRGFVQ